MSLVEGFFEHFGLIPDPRIDRTKRHKLTDILFIGVCTTICGGEGFTDMADFGMAREEWLRQYLDLPSGIPSHDTFRRVFMILDPEALLECFMDWSRLLHTETEGEVLALDGKVIRHSFDRASGQPALHTISAWATENGLTLGQIKVDADGNEITALPKLLKMLDITGMTVTIDAIGCQKDLAKQIKHKGGDYVLRVKANQESLHQNLARFFRDSSDLPEDEACYFKSVEKDHGRMEVRECWAVEGDPDLLGFGAEWVGLGSIAMMKRERSIGGKVSTETAYYISSLPPKAEQIAVVARSHWGIENSLHWVLDLNMNEDMGRVRKDNAPENLAVLRRIALNMLRKDSSTMKGRPSVRRRMKRAGWNSDYLAQILVA
jgi:predicted transposase YbfD/YdcC